jgi:hypothetical protein
MSLRALILAVMLVRTLGAQDITGNWQGVLRNFPGWPGARVSTGTPQARRVVVNISKNHSGHLTGMMYDREQGTDPLVLSSISVEDSKLSFTVVPIVGAALSYVGTVSPDGNSIDGWFQGQPVRLERTRQTQSQTPEIDAPVSAALENLAVKPLNPLTGDSLAPLERAREKLLRVANRLPKCTCIENIDRTFYLAPKNPGPHVMTEAPANSCSGLEFGRRKDLSLDVKDRLRLQVGIADGAEIYSWPTASRFDNRSVFEIVPGGPMSSGIFGTYLVDVFDNPGAEIKFEGRKMAGQRELFEYSFRIPVEASHYSVNAGSGWKITGYSGSFEIYAATAELARLMQETDELPPDGSMCRAKTTIDYHYVLIGDGQFLIPLRSVLQTLRANSDETTSLTTYSACHEYTAESSLRLDGDDGPTGAANSTPQTAPALPPGISLTLALTGPLDPAIAAGGDAISAKVTKAVRAPKSNEILVPAGAIAHGRIVQMQRRYSTSQFLIAIHFETLESQGAISPLSVRLAGELKAGKPRNGFKTRAPEFVLPPPSAETASWIGTPARGEASVIPAGYETKWITVPR